MALAIWILSVLGACPKWHFYIIQFCKFHIHESFPSFSGPMPQLITGWLPGTASLDLRISDLTCIMAELGIPVPEPKTGTGKDGNVKKIDIARKLVQSLFPQDDEACWENVLDFWCSHKKVILMYAWCPPKIPLRSTWGPEVPFNKFSSGIQDEIERMVQQLIRASPPKDELIPDSR